MELFETHGTFSENSRNFAENRWNFIKPMELKTDGTFLRAKKTMELFHRFLMDKNILLPVPAFTDKITMNVTVIAKTLLSCINHIELRIFFALKKVPSQKVP